MYIVRDMEKRVSCRTQRTKWKKASQQFSVGWDVVRMSATAWDACTLLLGFAMPTGGGRYLNPDHGAERGKRDEAEAH